MKISIVSVGDEILIGQVANTNVTWISAQVSMLGGLVIEHVTVADVAQDLTTTLDRLRLRCNIIIITGGLGPTHDDKTKETLTEYFADALVEDVATTLRLEELMKRLGRELSGRNASQALVPSTCTPIPNLVGTAPGMLFDRDGIIVASLPGVPHEMRMMMASHVLPRIQRHIAAEGLPTWEYRTLRTSAAAESVLADLIGDPRDFLRESALAFLPDYQGVRLRIGARGITPKERSDELDRIEAHIRPIIGQWIYGIGDTTLASAVGAALQKADATIAVAESCTGGMLGAAITSIAGSSAWFVGGVLSYANDVKVRELGVDQILLDAHGAVSKVVAEQMAMGVRSRFATTYGLSITGVAGPDGGTAEKPVGTVWVGVSSHSKTYAVSFAFGGDRMINRERSVAAALSLLLKDLA